MRDMARIRYIVEFGENDEENLETYMISNFILVVSGWVAADWTVLSKKLFDEVDCIENAVPELGLAP